MLRQIINVLFYKGYFISDARRPYDNKKLVIEFVIILCHLHWIDFSQ